MGGMHRRERPRKEAAPASSSVRAQPLNALPAASANGADAPGSAAPRMPCADTCRAMYRSTMPSMASAIARGTVRAESRTSPLVSRPATT